MSKGKDTENKQFYVWTKSERVGQIVELDDTTTPEKGWTLFTDGTKCNSALMSEFLIAADSSNHANQLANDFGGIITTAATPVRPRRDPENATPVRPRRDPEAEAEFNVMREMLKKVSVKNKANLPISVNIPSVDIYALLKDQMDITKKDLNGEITALVEDQIDNLRDELKQQIESFINNYYNGRANGKSNRTNTTDADQSGNS